ncbi:unnamed protein product [Rotaria sp. Silwood2]|nr:unnamed protein product [Rotaria sp. Silwood2]
MLNLQYHQPRSVFNPSSQIPLITNDDISLVNSRRLSSKEISTSLVNLVGTAFDSVPINNTIPIPTHETRDQQRYIKTIVRTRQRTSIESLLYIPSSFSSIDILRRICEQCAITNIEYFDSVLCDKKLPPSAACASKTDTEMIFFITPFYHQRMLTLASEKKNFAAQHFNSYTQKR